MKEHQFIRPALVGYALVVLLVLTLTPFRFAWPSTWVIAGWGDRADFPANFVLFLPLGYLFMLATSRVGRDGERAAFLFGAAVSALIEVAQLFLEARLTSMTDLLGNALGAAAGAMLCNGLRRRTDRAPPGVSSVDLPLTNLLYMLVPLMWLACTGVGGEPTRVWALAPLGMAGALVIIAVWRFRLHASLHLHRFWVVAAVAAWLALGVLIGVGVAPDISLVAAGAVMLASTAMVFLAEPGAGAQRRFEARVLRSVWPCYLVYLLIITVGSDIAAPTGFQLSMGYPQPGFDREFSLRIAEQLASLTVLGYLIGESLGRGSVSRRTRLLRSLLVAAACALGVEALHGILPPQGASALRGTLSMLAAIFGVLMYTSQLSLTRLLRSAPPTPSPGIVGMERGSVGCVRDGEHDRAGLGYDPPAGLSPGGRCNGAGGA